MLAATGASAASAAGPVLTMGIDAEDGVSSGTHGSVSIYSGVMSSVVLANTTNGGNGILVIGGNKAPADDVTIFWNQMGTLTGEPITYVNGPAAIAARPLIGFQAIAVVSTEPQTVSGGLTQAENDALGDRQPEIAAFVNDGGGLFGLSQDGRTNPYDYLPDSRQFSFTFDPSGGFMDIEATAAGESVGLTDTNLDVCCWHDEYLTFPPYLSILATNALTGNAVALGGAAVTLPEVCGNGIDDDGDGFVDRADSDCPPDPPETEITAGPAEDETLAVDTATFRFVSDEAESTFACSIDGGPFEPCTTPFTTPRLEDGGHRFEVRATDVEGDTDPTPARRDFGTLTQPCAGKRVTMYARFEEEVVQGTAKDDVILGGPLRDVVIAGAGDDTVCDREGDDEIKGGPGNDKLRGGPDDDLILAGGGADILSGRDGSDTLKGGPGEDFLNGNPGADSLNGGGGTDRCKGGAGSDKEASCERS